MQGKTTVWLDDKPGEKATWNEKELVENKEVIGGGVLDIIKYIISREQSFEYPDDPQSFSENLKLVMNKGDEENDFSNTNYCKLLIEDVLHYAIVGIEAEARFIVSTVFKYLVKLEFLKQEDEILKSLEADGWTEEDVNNPAIVAKGILKTRILKFGDNTEITRLTSDYVASYFDAKALRIKEITLKEAEDFFCKSSGKKFKAMAKSLNISHKDLQLLMSYKNSNNIEAIRKFIAEKRLEGKNIDNILKKMFRLNKDIGGYIGEQQEQVRNLVRRSGYAQKFSKFLFKSAGALSLVDAVITLKDYNEPEKMMDNLLVSAAGLISAGAGFGITALLVIGNDRVDRMEQDMFEAMYDQCGIQWFTLCKLNEDGSNFEFPHLKNLFLHYKREEHVSFFNKDVVPTSIRITDANLANEIFGFKPVYVNYFTKNDGMVGHVCCTRYSN